MIDLNDFVMPIDIVAVVTGQARLVLLVATLCDAVTLRQSLGDCQSQSDTD